MNLIHRPAGEFCGTSFAAVFGLPLLAVFCLFVWGTHRLIKWLAFRAGVRSQEAAFFIGFYLTPVIIVGLWFAVYFTVRGVQAP